ncbi:MAG TPA: tetratricopeptide repeat protein [Vicinamibacterales bacterium]
MSKRLGALFLLVVLTSPSWAVAQDGGAYFEFLLARRLEGQGDFAGAQAALERAAKVDARSSEVRAELGAFHLRRSQPEEAEGAAKASLAIDSANPEAHRVLGLVYAGYADGGTQRGPNPQVAQFLKDGIMHLELASASPLVNDLVLNFTLGRLYLRAGTPEKAVQSLTRVVSQNPGSVQARLLLAQAHAASKDLPAAISALDAIVDEEPRVAAALGQYQEQAGLLREAAATYTKALAVQPMSRELKARRITALYNAKDYATAASFAADARRQHPEDARFPRLQGRALFDAGSRDAGVSVLEAAAKTFPKDTPTLYALADIYRDAGRGVDAEQALRQVLVLEPTNPNALNYLGYLLAMRGDKLDEAVQLVRKALESEPDNGAYLDSLGWAYFRRGELAEAEKYLNAAAQRMPGNSEVQEHLGDVLARRGRLDDAIAAWTKAIDGDGEDVDVAGLRRKIDDARAKNRR